MGEREGRKDQRRRVNVEQELWLNTGVQQGGGAPHPSCI